MTTSFDSFTLNNPEKMPAPTAKVAIEINVNIAINTIAIGIVIIVLCNKKVAKYSVIILALSPIFTIAEAEEMIEVVIKNNINFESQNVMRVAYSLNSDKEPVFKSYWFYREKIKNFYIKNEVVEITFYYNKERIIKKIPDGFYRFS